MADERERGSGYKIDDVSASVIRNTFIPFVSLHFDVGGSFIYIYISMSGHNFVTAFEVIQFRR